MNYLLGVLVFYPMIGALACLLVGFKNEKARDYLADFIVVSEFVLMLVAAMQPEMALEIPEICGMGLHFTMDGFRDVYGSIAALMWMMTTILSREYFAHHNNRNRFYLFLLLTLMIFAFANPIVEDGKEFQDNSNDETEKVEKPEVIVDTNKNDNNYIPVVRPTQPVQNETTTEDKEDEIDTSYEDALEAVEYAEATYKAEDVEKAKELVNKVTDTTKKGELEDRLAEVEAGIEVMELIEELEYQVGKATEREDIVTAKDYRDENEVAKKLEALTNEDVKEALQERLDKVNEYLDDETAPKVNINDNDVFTEDVEIIVEDENDVTITLTNDG